MFYTLKSRLLSIFISVLLFSSLYTAFKIHDLMKATNNLNNVKSLVELASYISKFVHETQKERGMSAGFLGSKGKKFGNKLPKQRMTTDNQKAGLEIFLETFNYKNYPNSLKKSIKEIFKQVSELDSIRTRVSKLQISVKEEIQYYSSLNKKLLNIVPLTGLISKNSDLAVQLTAYANFLKSKERAGIERAVLSNTFARKGFAKGMFPKEIRLIAEQDAYMDSFLSSAIQKLIDFHNIKIDAQPVRDVLRMRKYAIDGNFTTDSVLWFSTITRKINILKQIDDYISQDSLDKILELKEDSNNQLYSYLIISIVFILFYSILILLISKSATDSVEKIKSDIKFILKNKDLVQEIKKTNIKEFDEIGSSINTLLSEFRAIINRVTSQTNATSKIGNKLKNMVKDLNTNIQWQELSLQEINRLTATIGQSNELTKVIMFENNKTLDAITKDLTGFMADLSEEVKLISFNNKKQIEISKDINKLTVEAKNMQDIIYIVSQLSDQTNLLSLNAGIEAARAGKQGRGFSVVAEEVKTLSENTQQSVDSIDKTVISITSVINTIDHEIERISKEMLSISTNATKLISESSVIQNRLYKTIEEIDKIFQKSEEVIDLTKDLLDEMGKITVKARDNKQISENTNQVAQDLSNESIELKKILTEYKV